jgi:hypothetical protein
MTVASYMQRVTALYQSSALRIAQHLYTILSSIPTDILLRVDPLLPYLPSVDGISYFLFWLCSVGTVFSALLCLKVAVGWSVFHYCAYVHNKELDEIARESDISGEHQSD